MKNVKNDLKKLQRQEVKSSFYREQLLTVEDLDIFKKQLVFEIKNLLKEYLGQATKKWLRSKDVMKLLQVSPGKLQTLRDNGTIPFKKMGGTIIYDSESIQKVLES